MIHRIVDMPRALHELFGPRARLSTVIIAFATAGVAAILVALNLLQDGITGWRMILATLVLFDVAGGVVANLSSNTADHPFSQGKARLGFLAFHVVHPLLIWVAIPGAWSILLPATVLTLAAAFAVNEIEDLELQQNVAAACLVLGTLLCCLVPVASEVLYAFCPLYMAKLALGFAVRRPSFLP